MLQQDVAKLVELPLLTTISQHRFAVRGRPTNLGLCGQRRHTPMKGHVSFISRKERCSINTATLRGISFGGASNRSPNIDPPCMARRSLYVATRALALLLIIIIKDRKSVVYRMSGHATS